MSQSYKVAKNPLETCYEIKKSRFIARLKRVCSREEAVEFLERAKQDYPDARHHCWAYQFGPPMQPTSAAMSDDGEPNGTAGKPILNVIQHKDLGDVMVIIIRYFGGIKLGAGGLVRAYSHATQLAFDEVDTLVIKPKENYTVTCDFSNEQSIRHWLSQHQGEVQTSNYTEQVSISLTIDPDTLPDFSDFIGALPNAALVKD